MLLSRECKVNRLAPLWRAKSPSPSACRHYRLYRPANASFFKHPGQLIQRETHVCPKLGQCYKNGQTARGQVLRISSQHTTNHTTSSLLHLPAFSPFPPASRALLPTRAPTHTMKPSTSTKVVDVACCGHFEPLLGGEAVTMTKLIHECACSVSGRMLEAETDRLCCQYRSCKETASKLRAEQHACA